MDMILHVLPEGLLLFWVVINLQLIVYGTIIDVVLMCAQKLTQNQKLKMEKREN